MLEDVRHAARVLGRGAERDVEHVVSVIGGKVKPPRAGVRVQQLNRRHLELRQLHDPLDAESVQLVARRQVRPLTIHTSRQRRSSRSHHAVLPLPDEAG